MLLLCQTWAFWSVALQAHSPLASAYHGVSSVNVIEGGRQSIGNVPRRSLDLLSPLQLLLPLLRKQLVQGNQLLVPLFMHMDVSMPL
jgi:hypothetical protein